MKTKSQIADQIAVIARDLERWAKVVARNPQDDEGNHFLRQRYNEIDTMLQIMQMTREQAMFFINVEEQRSERAAREWDGTTLQASQLRLRCLKWALDS